MKKHTWWLAFAVLAGAGCSGSGEPGTKKEAQSKEPPKVESSTTLASGDAVKFAEVQAVFTENCVKCHSGAGAKGQIDLSSYEGAMKGGAEGPIIAAGDPENSKILMALKGQGARQMPMMAEPLPSETITKVEAWIKDGAKKD